MLSNRVFDLYKTPLSDSSISHIDTHTYLPYIKSFKNNDIIEITINRNDVWLLMCDAALSINGKLSKTSGDGTVKFVNNAGAFFFDSISYLLNGIEMEHVRDPGITSLIRGYLSYTEEDSKHLNVAGWNYPNVPSTYTDGQFFMRIPLYHLFGIFVDYKMAISGKHTIRLVRARNDDNCMLITPKPNETTPTQAELIIDNIELKVKHIIPNDMLKIELLQSVKSDRPILIPFRKWELHELPALNAGARKEMWSVRTTTNVDCPRYVVVAFQNDRKDIATKDNTKFDNIDVSGVRLFLNGEYYPYERQNIDFKKDNFAEAHYAYTEFHSSFTNNMLGGVASKRPLLNYEKFKEKALFVIDCSRRDENLKSSAIDVKIEIETWTGFPDKTKVYCVIIHDCVMEYLPLSEIVRKIN